MSNGTDSDTARARADALAFLKRNKTAVLATCSSDGEVHASMIYYHTDDDFSIYFLTLINSRKYEALVSHPQVALTIATPDVPQTLQIEGTAQDISVSDEARGKKEEIFEVLNSNQFFYPPVSKLDPATTVIIWLKPTWIRWADYAFSRTGTSNVFRMITP